MGRKSHEPGVGESRQPISHGVERQSQGRAVRNSVQAACRANRFPLGGKYPEGGIEGRAVRYSAWLKNLVQNPLPPRYTRHLPPREGDFALSWEVVGGQSRARYRFCGAHPSLPLRGRWIARRARRRGDEKLRGRVTGHGSALGSQTSPVRIRCRPVPAGEGMKKVRYLSSKLNAFISPLRRKSEIFASSTDCEIAPGNF